MGICQPEEKNLGRAYWTKSETIHIFIILPLSHTTGHNILGANTMTMLGKYSMDSYFRTATQHE